MADASWEVRYIAALDEDALVAFFDQLKEDASITNLFHPHPFDQETAQEVAHALGRDVYLGCFSGSRLLGYAMLRGWDQGYEIPSFGVAVLPSHQGMGIGSRLLLQSLDIARQRGADKIMLKVYPDNDRAVAWYQSVGFRRTGQASDGQMVYHLDLPRRDVRSE